MQLLQLSFPQNPSWKKMDRILCYLTQSLVSHYHYTHYLFLIHYHSYVNFLRQEDLCDNIVTNPPFSLSTEFCMKALKLARNKVAIFNKLSFLESKIRQHIFKQGYLKNIYVYSKRVNLQKNQQQNIGMLAFAWFVFDKTYQGRPTLDWI